MRTETYRDGTSRNFYDHDEEMKINPDNILFMSQRKGDYDRYCTRLTLITGQEVLVNDDMADIEKKVDAFYKEREKDNKDKIVITKDDVVKNFIFKNMIQ